MKDCEICKERIQIPHWLPCNHEFCYICIRRHLENRNFCPTCLKYPLNLSDLRTNEKIKSNIKRPISLFKITVFTLKSELKKFRVRTDGSFDRLKWRYNELCLQIDNDRYKETPRSIDTIARQLHMFETNLFSREHELDESLVYKHLIELKQNMNKDSKNNVRDKIKDNPLESNSYNMDCSKSKKNNLLRYVKKVDS